MHHLLLVHTIKRAHSSAQMLVNGMQPGNDGVGRTITIEAVYAAAKRSGIKRVYWQTHHTNAAGRLLYDKVAKHYGFVVYAHDV